MFTFGSLGQGMVCVGRLCCFQGLHLLHASIVASSLPVVCCWPFCFPDSGGRPSDRRLGVHPHVPETDRHTARQTERQTAGQIRRGTLV